MAAPVSRQAAVARSPRPLARVASAAAHDPSVPKYTVNDRAFDFARELIERRQYVLRSDWAERQPSTADQNRYLRTHDWDEYAAWHLGLTDGARDETKTRYAF